MIMFDINKCSNVLTQLHIFKSAGCQLSGFSIYPNSVLSKELFREKLVKINRYGEV